MAKRLTVICPKCGFADEDVLFNPRYGFVEWHCPRCECVVDLVKKTGIGYQRQTLWDYGKTEDGP